MIYHGWGPSIKYVRFRGWVGVLPKAYFCVQGWVGVRSNNVYMLLKKIDCEYVDNKIVVAS